MAMIEWLVDRGKRFEKRSWKYEVLGRGTKLEIRSKRFEIRSKRFEIRSKRFEIRNTRFEVRSLRLNIFI